MLKRWKRCCLYRRSCCVCSVCKRTCCQQNDCSGRIQTVCTCSRYADVPMTIYYGPGYTDVDCCKTQTGILQDISDALSRCCPRDCCGCQNCC